MTRGSTHSILAPTKEAGHTGLWPYRLRNREAFRVTLITVIPISDYVTLLSDSSSAAFATVSLDWSDRTPVARNHCRLRLEAFRSYLAPEEAGLPLHVSSARREAMEIAAKEEDG